jgi:hypothetical protein
MLSCRMPTPTDFERRHLVVELKRPSQPVNEDIISQVKKYAKAVATDDRFKATGVEWDFIALSNSLTRDAEIETWQTGKPRGLVAEYDDPKIRVWAKTSGQIISEAEGRLTFYKRRLEYKADDVEALRYLRTVDPERGSRRKLRRWMAATMANQKNERLRFRAAAWPATISPLANTEVWLRDGRPGNTTLSEYTGPEPKLTEGEAGLLDAIDNRRRRVRELKADLHRIQTRRFRRITPRQDARNDRATRTARSA